MRPSVLFALSAALLVGPFGLPEPPVAARQKDEKKDGKTGPGNLTTAAEQTLSRALKAKVSGSFTDVRLGDILKEFAAQVETTAEVPLLWAYGPAFPYAQKVTYRCTDRPLEAALDELFKKGGLGYVVVSNDGDRRDGWVLLTTTGERGVEKKATAAEEAGAAEKLALAKKLLDGGKGDQAKTVLEFVVKRYPSAKAAAEARALLEKLEK